MPAKCNVGDHIARHLVLADSRTSLQHAVHEAFESCPSLASAPRMLAPEMWMLWPCPECIQVCTRTPLKDALQRNVEGKQVLPYLPCVEACSKNCRDDEFERVWEMSDAKRRTNYRAPSRPPASSTRPIGTLFGVLPLADADAALKTFKVVPDALFPAEICSQDGVRCGELDETKPTKFDGQKMFKTIRFATAGRDLRQVSFLVRLPGVSHNARVAQLLVAKTLGRPTALLEDEDAAAPSSLFLDTSNGDPGLHIATWSFRDAEVHAYLLAYNPFYREAHAIEFALIRPTQAVTQPAGKP